MHTGLALFVVQGHVVYNMYITQKFVYTSN